MLHVPSKGVTVDSTSGGLPRAPHEEAWCHHFVDFLAPMGKKRGAHKPDVKPVDATTPSPDRCASPAPEDPFQMAHAASLPPRVTTWLHVCVSRVGRIGWRGAGLGRVDTALLMRMTRESPRITHRYTVTPHTLRRPLLLRLQFVQWAPRIDAVVCASGSWLMEMSAGSGQTAGCLA